MKQIEIKFRAQDFLKYRIIDGHENEWETISNYFPLPWGYMEVENCLIEGSVFQSAGGCWYWKLPEYCIMGYGQYDPYVRFRFTGTIRVTKERDFCNGFKKYGWRQNHSKWIYLDGKITPCQEYIKEKKLEKIINKYTWGYHYSDIEGDEEYQQGHLTVIHNHSLAVKIIEDPKFEEVTKIYFSRRKIYNHQFFGDVQILRIANDQSWACWVIIAPNGGKIVSPDHLDEPIELIPGLSFCFHPQPDEDID
jgi:hypothetical protein